MQLERRASLRTIAAVGLGSVPVIALGLADGGFYPRPWGWAAFGLGCAIVVAAAGRREPFVSSRALTLLLLLAALGAWMAFSLLWTRSTGLSAFELERLLVYLTGVGAAVLVVRPGSERRLLAGVLAGTSAISVYGLAFYLLTRERETDVLQGSFLHRPLGYANGMAIVTVMAILLALGTISASKSRDVRASLAALLVPLASSLALTGSRAGIGALVAGGAFALAVASDRLRLLGGWTAVLVVPASAFVLVSTSNLTSSAIVGEAADSAGTRTLALVLGLTVVAAGWALISSLPRRWPRALPRSTGVVLVAVLGGTLSAALVTARPDLAGDRPTYWRVAVDEFVEEPLQGSGAGTFSQVWLEGRPGETSVRDAHSIVIEAGAELGLVGLVLVVTLLGVPLVWALRGRGRPLAPAAGGAFAAFAAHACVDWDWELPAVALAGLFCAVALGSMADGGARGIMLRPANRAAAAALGASAAVLAVGVFVGASALEEASRALARGDFRGAERAAARAERWQPWSVEPMLLRGRARLAEGDTVGAQVHFVRATRRDPRDYRAWLALAAVSDADAAHAAVQRARGLNPHAVADLSGS